MGRLHLNPLAGGVHHPGAGVLPGLGRLVPEAQRNLCARAEAQLVLEANGDGLLEHVVRVAAQIEGVRLPGIPGQLTTGQEFHVLEVGGSGGHDFTRRNGASRDFQLNQAIGTGVRAAPLIA